MQPNGDSGPLTRGRARQGLWHYQNPHLGPGHKLGVTDASVSRHLAQNALFRMYVAGLVHHSPDRIVPGALKEVAARSRAPLISPESRSRRPRPKLQVLRL